MDNALYQIKIISFIIVVRNNLSLRLWLAKEWSSRGEVVENRICMEDF